MKHDWRIRARIEDSLPDATAPTPERVAEIESVTDHDTAAFVDAVAEQLGPEGRWFHYGLTVVGRRRHRARAAGPGRRHARSRRDRPRARRASSRRARRAPAHDLHRPLARRFMRSRRPSAGSSPAGRSSSTASRTRVCARARGRTVSGSSRERSGRTRRSSPEVERIAVRATRARAGPALDAGDRPRPTRRAAVGARARARRRSTASRPRSAISRAPRCARSRSRSARA